MKRKFKKTELQYYRSSGAMISSHFSFFFKKEGNMGKRDPKEKKKWKKGPMVRLAFTFRIVIGFDSPLSKELKKCQGGPGVSKELVGSGLSGNE